MEKIAWSSETLSAGKDVPSCAADLSPRFLSRGPGEVMILRSVFWVAPMPVVVRSIADPPLVRESLKVELVAEVT